VHGEICRVRRVWSFLHFLSFPRQKLNEEQLNLERKKESEVCKWLQDPCCFAIVDWNSSRASAGACFDYAGNFKF
jgi:hypothetical protein